MSISIPTIEFPKTDAIIQTLPNGLQVILKTDRSAPVASIQAWCRTGSIFEGPLLGSGVSHLVEHMVFKGAGNRNTAGIAQDVQKEGGYINAYTSFDRTVYWIDTPNTGVKTAIDVVASLVAKATFPEDEFEREKDVIRREIDMGKDDPGREASRLMFSTVFQKHPYREPVIGHLDVFNSVTHSQMVNYYQTHYIPNNVFFVIVGDVDEQEVMETVAAAYEGIERRAYEPVIVTPEPMQLGRREVHETFDTQLTKLCLGWRIPGLTHPDMPALDVLASVLGSGRSSRLFREIREEQSLVHSIGAFSYTPAQEGIFAVSADLDPEKAEATRAAVLAQLDRIKNDGISATELGKALRMSLSDQLDTLTTMRGQAGDIGGNWLSAGNLDFTREYVLGLSHVRPEDVQAVAQKYLVDRTLTVTSLNPRRTASSVTAAATSSRTGDIARTTLSNGLTLLTLEDMRLPLVTFYANFRGGLLSETAATSGLGKLHARTMLKGTESRTAEEIHLAIEEAGGSIGASSGGSSLGLALEVLQPDTLLALDILADILLLPSFPEKEVTREKEALIAGIKAQEDQLVQVAFRELRGALFPAIHPFHLPPSGTEGSVAALERPLLPEFHAEHICGGNGVISVFGAIRAEEMRDQIEEALAAMPTGERRVTSPEILAATGPVEREIAVTRDDKRQAVLAIAFPAPELVSPNRFALDLIDEACSDMASRIFVRIREELGLAYYVSATQMLGMAPGAFVFYLGTSPEQLAQAESVLLDEIDKLSQHGLTSEELHRAQMQSIGKQTIQNQSNASLARQVALDELYGLGLNAHKQLTERILAVTEADILRAAQSVFLPEKRVVVRVRP
ncbi:MAG: pitrilysin family protein [Verrucomicrobiales bacterium]